MPKFELRLLHVSDHLFINTSTKIRKGRSLFNAAQRLNAFVKNAVAFLKLCLITNAVIGKAAFVNQAH